MIHTVVINQKGGVGKTTTAVNLGAALARRGKRVLLLDMDPQANLTLHLDLQPELEARTMTSLLVDDAPLSELIVKTGCEGLYLVPADTSLSGVEQVLANRIGRETILREALDAYQGPPTFDHVLMDCPPALGVLSANALVAGDDVIVPTQAEYLAMHGMAKLMEVVLLVKRRLNPDLEISFILPCMVDQRTRLSSEVIQEIRQHFGDILANTNIRSNVKLAEAPSFGRTIFQHAPDSNGARDYMQFAEEFLARHAMVKVDEGAVLVKVDEGAPIGMATEETPAGVEEQVQVPEQVPDPEQEREQVQVQEREREQVQEREQEQVQEREQVQGQEQETAAAREDAAGAAAD
jgi:chromosome partitioning protein